MTENEMFEQMADEVEKTANGTDEEKHELMDRMWSGLTPVVKVMTLGNLVATGSQETFVNVYNATFGTKIEIDDVEWSQPALIP